MTAKPIVRAAVVFDKSADSNVIMSLLFSVVNKYLPRILILNIRYILYGILNKNRILRVHLSICIKNKKKK